MISKPSPYSLLLSPLLSPPSHNNATLKLARWYRKSIGRSTGITSCTIGIIPKLFVRQVKETILIFWWIGKPISRGTGVANASIWRNPLSSLSIPVNVASCPIMKVLFIDHNSDKFVIPIKQAFSCSSGTIHLPSDGCTLTAGNRNIRHICVKSTDDFVFTPTRHLLWQLSMDGRGKREYSSKWDCEAPDAYGQKIFTQHSL